MIRRAARIAHVTLIMALTCGSASAALFWAMGSAAEPWTQEGFWYQGRFVSVWQHRRMASIEWVWEGDACHEIASNCEQVFVGVHPNTLTVWIVKDLAEPRILKGASWQSIRQWFYFGFDNLNAHGVPIPQKIGVMLQCPAKFPVLVFAAYPILVMLRALRRRRRRKRGLCVACGYNLKGLPEPRCPECGREFER